MVLLPEQDQTGPMSFPRNSDKNYPVVTPMSTGKIPAWRPPAMILIDRTENL